MCLFSNNGYISSVSVCICSRKWRHPWILQSSLTSGDKRSSSSPSLTLSLQGSFFLCPTGLLGHPHREHKAAQHLTDPCVYMPVLRSFHFLPSEPAQKGCLLPPEKEESHWASLYSELVLEDFFWVAMGIVVFVVWFTQCSTSCPCSDKETQVKLYTNWGWFQFFASQEIPSYGFGYTFSLYKSVRMADAEEVRMGQTSPKLSQSSPNHPLWFKVWSQVLFTNRFILHMSNHFSLYLYWFIAQQESVASSRISFCFEPASM